MTEKESSRILTGLLTATGIFIAAILLPKLVVAGLIPRLLTTQSLELALSLLAIGILGKGQFSAYGFRFPQVAEVSLMTVVRWIPVGLLAIALGALATSAILLTGASGNPLVKQLSFPQMVLFIWIFSSTIEEIFTRGFLLSHLSQGLQGKIKFLFFSISKPVLISALFFGAMHLILPLSGADLTSTVIIFLFTFSLGLLAGSQREKTGSLIPAIGVHMLANIGGMVGGILYFILGR